jgi:hypothetical protein
MAQDYAASVLGQAIRVTRLQADGSPATGASASYVMSGGPFISLSFTPEYEEGDEITQKGADGTVCVSFKAPDTLKRVTLEIAICNPDPEFTELTSGGVLLSSGGKSVGWAAPTTGTDATPYGVSVEVWSLAITGGKPSGTNRYYRWVFPYAVLRPSGDRVIENGLMANTFEGWGVGNSAWGDGPQNDWPFIAVTDRAYMYARTNTAPIGITGYQTGLA